MTGKDSRPSQARERGVGRGWIGGRGRDSWHCEPGFTGPEAEPRVLVASGARWMLLPNAMPQCEARFLPSSRWHVGPLPR
eukprot:COSAG01_NODE_104_length_26171_cov_96.617612_11_plen_80_part_00